MSTLLVAVALAVAPRAVDGVSLEPHRPWATHPLEQAELRGPAWEALSARLPGAWRVTHDPGNGTVHALWGEGLPIAATGDAAIAAEVAARVAELAPWMGLGDGALRVASVATVERVHTTYVDLELLYDGAPVVRGGVRARVKHGRLVLLLADLHGPTPRRGAFVIGEDAALAAVVAGSPAPAAAHRPLAARRAWLERSGLDGLRLQAVWEIHTRTDDPVGMWVGWVDAATGELLHLSDRVAWASGVVEGRHHARTLDDPLVRSPLPSVVVRSGGASDVTDASGAYSVNGATATADLDGDYVTVQNAAGPEAEVSGGGDLLFDASNSELAEVSAYVFSHQVRAWGAANAPEVAMVDVPLVANVNLNSVCNAYYDPYQNSINFFVAGSSCNNTGEVADIVYHEWGHGFHLYSIESGTWDGSVGEGAADVVSMLQTLDSRVGPTFFVNGDPVRNMAPDKVYPRDYDNSPYAVHSNGLIFGGAMWDLLGNLQALYGDTDGLARTTDIFTGLLKGGPNIPDTYYEALVADDTDGNLANGTPHQCSIDDAFGRHGLGPGDGVVAPVVAYHVVPERIAADEPFVVQVSAGTGSADCAEEVVGGTLHYRVDGGDWREVDGAPSAAGLDAEIPPQPIGAMLEYWVEVRTPGGTGLAPWQGETAPYTAVVGDVLVLRCDDFEADDGGYTHALLDGEPTTGADDWMWGFPNGKGGDPSRAASGDRVWGTDLGPDDYQGNDWNGQYQSEKHTRLTAPSVETGHYEGVFLRYQRWLSVEDGAFDAARILANGEVVWSNAGSGGEEHTLDNQWMWHAVGLGGRADRGAVEVAYELVSDGGLEFGGWTLDDVCVLAPATTDNRMGITDFEADAEDDGTVTLSWTQPKWDPVERVVVVRHPDRYPEHEEDGVVVYDAIDVEAGAAETFVDDNRTFVDGYYAVYGFDGDGWLSWTIEGWNADEVAGNERILELREDWEAEQAAAADAAAKGGCGCQSTGAGGAWLLALGALGLRRRR